MFNYSLIFITCTHTGDDTFITWLSEIMDENDYPFIQITMIWWKYVWKHFAHQSNPIWAGTFFITISILMQNTTELLSTEQLQKNPLTITVKLVIELIFFHRWRTIFFFNKLFAWTSEYDALLLFILFTCGPLNRRIWWLCVNGSTQNLCSELEWL